MFIDCISKGLDHNGGDIRKERSNTPEECGNHCRQNSGCRRWTFVTAENNGTCVLKKESNNSINPCLPCLSGFQNSGSTKCGENGKYAKKRFTGYVIFRSQTNCN